MRERRRHFAQRRQVLQLHLTALSARQLLGATNCQYCKRHDQQAAQSHQPKMMLGMFGQKICGRFGNVNARDALSLLWNGM